MPKGARLRFPTAHLPSSTLFDNIPEHLSITRRLSLSLERARVIALQYSLTLEDVLHHSPKFYNMWLDFIVTLDGAAVALLSIQFNLAAGTLAPYVEKRPDLKPLIEDVLSFRVSAQFLLTELGHGLDAQHLETFASLKQDGTFDLTTPNPRAAKWMPPTLPCASTPRIGLVVARLIISGADHGLRMFIVPLNDGQRMCRGITAMEIPTRTGSKALGHALTYFHRVQLPASALLGDLEIPADPRRHFLKLINRVSVGSLTLSAVAIPGIKMAAYIGILYSKRRHVTGARGSTIPILSFRTQQLPLYHALAQGYVLEELYHCTVARTRHSTTDDIETASALRTIAKVTIMGHWRRTGCTIADRCGAQGLFDFNQIMPMEMELRGVAIAEGDVLGTSIRLAAELLLQRYFMPQSQYPNSLLARHEDMLFKELRALLTRTGTDARNIAFNRLFLPRCVSLIEAIGHRMAWEAAVSSDVPQPLVRLYEIGAVGTDLAWYIESANLQCTTHFEEEDAALSAVDEHLDEYVNAMGAAPYATAAIVTEKSWDRFVDKLTVHRGEAVYNPLLSAESQPLSRL